MNRNRPEQSPRRPPLRLAFLHCLPRLQKLPQRPTRPLAAVADYRARRNHAKSIALRRWHRASDQNGVRNLRSRSNNHRRHSANLNAILTIFVIAVASCARAQTLAAAKMTKADAQRVFQIISGDKVKTRVYCEMGKLGEQMEQANEKGDSKKFDELFQRMYELGKKLGPEYAALIDGLEDIDPVSEVGQEISSTFDALDNLCGR